MCWGWWPSSSLSEKSSTIHRSSTWNWFSAAHHEAEVGTAAPMDAMKSPKNLMRLTRWIWLHWASSKESRKQGKERNEKKKERKRTNEHLKKSKENKTMQSQRWQKSAKRNKTKQQTGGSTDMHLHASKHRFVNQHRSYIITPSAEIRTVAALGAVAAGKTWQLWLSRPDDFEKTTWDDQLGIWWLFFSSPAILGLCMEAHIYVYVYG